MGCAGEAHRHQLVFLEVFRYSTSSVTCTHCLFTGMESRAGLVNGATGKISTRVIGPDRLSRPSWILSRLNNFCSLKSRIAWRIRKIISKFSRLMNVWSLLKRLIFYNPGLKCASTSNHFKNNVTTNLYHISLPLVYHWKVQTAQVQTQDRVYWRLPHNGFHLSPLIQLLEKHHRKKSFQFSRIDCMMRWPH